MLSPRQTGRKREFAFRACFPEVSSLQIRINESGLFKVVGAKVTYSELAAISFPKPVKKLENDDESESDSTALDDVALFLPDV